MMSETGILADTSDPSGQKNGRSRFSFSRPKLKGTTNLEEAARKSAESARVNNNNNNSQSRYIILPSNKKNHQHHHHNQLQSHHHHHHQLNHQSHHQQQIQLNQQQHHHQSHRRSSPTSTSSSPLIDFLTCDDPTSDLGEETHILIPSPLFPTSSQSSDISLSNSSAPPRPSTRHPGCNGESSCSGSAKDAVEEIGSACVTGSGSGNSNGNSALSGSGLSQRGDGSGLVNKPPKGWLHPEQVITSIGVTYSVKYIGCLEINTSMRSLDFETRSNIAKECISRVCKASGLPVQEPNRKSDTRILKMLADEPNLNYTGCQVNLSVTSASLNLTVIDTGEVIAKHDMPNISFASNGDIELMDFVSYVAKDTEHGRACFVLHCGGGSAQDVINTIGQAFELRFKEFLKRAPRLETKSELANVEIERDYYNDLPGKMPPDMGCAPSSSRMSCNLMPSIGSNNSPSVGDPRIRFPQAAPRKKADDQEDQSNLIDLGFEPAIREYVNYHSPTSHLRDEPANDPFDMKPFNSTLKELSRQRLVGDELFDTHTWFHGTISRKESETLVQKDGDFLVRESIGSPGQFVLTGKQGGLYQHLLLVDPNGIVRTKDLSFDTVSHLIRHHKENNLPIVSAESVLHLRNPVCAQSPTV